MDKRRKSNSVLAKTREFFDSNRRKTFKIDDVARYIVKSLDSEYKNKFASDDELLRHLRQIVASILNGQIDKRSNWKKVGYGVYKFLATKRQ